jgi:uncharacterized protein YndB with AHSA1/START domain
MSSEETFRLSDRDGTVTASSVRFERILDHSVERVWAALTEPDQLSVWLGQATVEGGAGGTIILQMTGATNGGKILQWKENMLLEYEWYKDSIVRWELLKEGVGRCRLIFTTLQVVSSQVEGAAIGWHFHMDALGIMLDGGTVPYKYAVAHWADLSRPVSARYAEQLGALRHQSTPAPFVIERTFDAPVARVWQALTDNEEIKHWSFTIADFKPEVGYDFTFDGENEGRKFVHICRITEVIPERKLAYSWRYEDIAGISHVSFELFPEGQRTRLRLTHEGLENLAHAGRDFVRSNFEAGWTSILDKGLAPLLSKQPVIQS